MTHRKEGGVSTALTKFMRLLLLFYRTTSLGASYIAFVGRL